jgi:hypothetical protein
MTAIRMTPRRRAKGSVASGPSGTLCPSSDSWAVASRRTKGPRRQGESTICRSTTVPISRRSLPDSEDRRRGDGRGHSRVGFVARFLAMRDSWCLSGERSRVKAGCSSPHASRRRVGSRPQRTRRTYRPITDAACCAARVRRRFGGLLCRRETRRMRPVGHERERRWSRP